MSKKKRSKLNLDLIRSAIEEQTTDYTIGVITDKPISHVIVQDGVLEVRRNQIGTFIRKNNNIDINVIKQSLSAISKFPGLQGPVNDINSFFTNLPKSSEFKSFQFNLPKIPLSIMFQVVNFFKQVHDVHKTEAAALIRWNEANGYYIEVPTQDPTTVHVNYKGDKNNNDVIVMDVHSHHTMAPNFSSIDDGDEVSTRIFAVMGHIEYGFPAINIRVRMNGKDICYIRAEEVFDIQESPSEWMNKLVFKKETPLEQWWNRKDFEAGPVITQPIKRYGGRTTWGNPQEWKDPEVKEVKSHFIQQIDDFQQRPEETETEYLNRLKGVKNTKEETKNIFEEVWDFLQLEMIDHGINKIEDKEALLNFIDEKMGDEILKENVSLL